jgi:hypothetical protein
MIRLLAALFLLGAVAGFLSSASPALGRHAEIIPQTATLVARRTVNGYDNYDLATFSFKYGGNGPITRRLTHNNWDILFGNSPDRDTFDVTMVTDDRSRIKDLGALSWDDTFTLPSLEAYSKPTREPSVSVVAGHMYLVHSRDRDNDHYALFRVEDLQPLQSVTISWKLIPAPERSGTNHHQRRREMLLQPNAAASCARPSLS